MQKMIELFRNAELDFDVSDWAIFKVCIFLLGLLVGGHCYKKVKSFKPFIVLGFIITCGYLIYKMFFKDNIPLTFKSSSKYLDI